MSMLVTGTTGFMVSFFFWFLWDFLLSLTFLVVSSSRYGSWLTGGSGMPVEPRALLLLYAMFAYSCKSGNTERRNWQKSFLMPNHPGIQERCKTKVLFWNKLVYFISL